MAVQPIADIDRKHGYVIVTWETLGDDDTGAPFQAPDGYYLESVQFIGTLGGASLVVNGSNNESTYAALDTETALGFALPNNQALSYQPQTTGGTGSDVDAIAYFVARF